MAKVSVIIPVYKVEATLKQCVDSVIGQSFTDLEIILIDDGSPDSCGLICDAYSKKDKRVRVLHKENAGLASARNDGIKMATADWILFVDSDDWIEKEFIEKLYRPDFDKYSISISGAVLEYHKGCSKKRFGINGTNEIKDKEMLNIVQVNALAVKFNPIENGIKIDLIAVPWNKLYNRLLIIEKSIYFSSSLAVNEDSYFNLCYFSYVRHIVVINNFGYHYWWNACGITNKFDQQRLCKDEVFFNKLFEFSKGSDNEYLKEYIYACICQQFIVNLRRYYFATNNPNNMLKRIKILKETLDDEKYTEAFSRVNHKILSRWQNIVIYQAKQKRAIIIMIMHYLNRIRKRGK